MFDVYIITDKREEVGYHSAQDKATAKAWCDDAINLSDVIGGYVVEADSNKIIYRWGAHAVSSG